MENSSKTSITIEAIINASVEKVWEFWNKPEHIMQWCNASDDWEAPYAENDLQVGGKFTTTMAAKDGSVSFDFGGIYTAVEVNKLIAYTIGDGRKVRVEFSGDANETKVVEIFEAESQNSIELQRAGWQAILNNFKKYTEGN